MSGLSFRRVRRAVRAGWIDAIGIVAFSIVANEPAPAQVLPGFEIESDAPATSETPPASVAPETTPENDRAIAERLGAIFATVDELAAVEVVVHSGVVQLTGEVLSSDAAERAIRIARQLRGVVEVENKIEIVSDVGRRLLPALAKLRARVTGLLQLLPLIGVAVVVFALFCGLAWLATRWQRPYRSLVRNTFARDLLKQAVRTLIVAAGAMTALGVLDATAIVATVAGIAGLAGLAVSFAFRDLAENYIASVLLSLRHPFLPDDHILIGTSEGRVVRLTSRATVLIDFAGNHVRIPNSTVFKSVIQNFTRNPLRRFDFTVGVAPDVDLAEVLELGIGTLARLPGTRVEPPAQGWIDELGDWNVVLHFYAWIDQREADWFRMRSEAIRVVKEAFDANRIAMPEPTMHVLPMRPDEEKKEQAAVEHRRALAADPPALELDTSPDPHLDRAVARDRAESEATDLLDPDAPGE